APHARTRSPGDLRLWPLSRTSPGRCRLRTRRDRRSTTNEVACETGLSGVWLSPRAHAGEALPWVAMKYAQPDPWLVENARKFNLQNRLGFVVSLARRVAEMRQGGSRSAKLTELENLLDDSRLAKED